MPKDYLVCTLPCLGYFDTSYYCAVLSDQLSQYKPIPRPNFAPESSYLPFADVSGPRLIDRAGRGEPFGPPDPTKALPAYASLDVTL